MMIAAVLGWAECVGRRQWKTFFLLEFTGLATRLTVQQVAQHCW
jgi:hypothetical protein